MQVKSGVYTISFEGIEDSYRTIPLSDVMYVKLIEGTTKFQVKVRNRPLYSASGIPNVNIKIGNARISTNGDRNRESAYKCFTLKVREDEVQTVHEILMSGMPNVRLDERNVKYTESRRALIIISTLVFFALTVGLFLALDFVTLPAVFDNPLVIMGTSAGVALLINIIGFITMDRSKRIRVYR